MNQPSHNAEAAATANPTATSSRRDVKGWIILAWVVVWSAVYFQSAVLHRFPGLLSWVGVEP